MVAVANSKLMNSDVTPRRPICRRINKGQSSLAKGDTARLLSNSPYYSVTSSRVMADILRLIEPENVIRSADPENYILEPNINMKWIE